ncbi:MAG: PaaI family thioesterase [Pseudomonadota bacterium]
MNDAIPEGFESVALGSGFSSLFGPVYRHHTESRLGFRVAPQHLNPVQVCHGGAMATFADMQIAVVAPGLGTQAGHTPTIHLDMDYLAVAPLGSWVEMAVTRLRETRNLIFTQALITADGEPVARSSGIYRNRPAAG